MFKLPYTDTDGLPVSISIQTVDDIIHYCNELTDLHKIYDIFEEYYGEDRVDIQYINQETLDQFILTSTLLNPERVSIFNIIVYFPEITITNDYKETHTIYDTYCKISISADGRYRGFKIARATLDKQEYLTGYIHSHATISSRLVTGVWRDFCFGASIFCDTIREVSLNKLDSWSLFCLQLDELLKVESNEGVPYKSLNTIYSSGENSFIKNKYLVSFICTVLSSQDVEYLLSNYNFKFEIVNNTVAIAEHMTDFAINISKLYLDYLEKEGSILIPNLPDYCIKDGTLYKYTNLNAFTELENPIKVLTFKGKDINLTIKDTDDTNVVLYKILPIQDINYIATRACALVNSIFNNDYNYKLLPETYESLGIRPHIYDNTKHFYKY
jgi:hypothetical protein